MLTKSPIRPLPHTDHEDGDDEGRPPPTPRRRGDDGEDNFPKYGYEVHDTLGTTGVIHLVREGERERGREGGRKRRSVDLFEPPPPQLPTSIFIDSI